MERSGGIVTNIGIHFFDLLLWLFGSLQESTVHLHDERRAAGALELERASVLWFLSAKPEDLPVSSSAWCEDYLSFDRR